MRILVTGGSGFIGKEVVNQLLAMGHTVRVYDLMPNGTPGIEMDVTSSVLDPVSLTQAAHGCDAIMHMAAIVGVNRTESRRLECMSVNTEGTIHALQAAVATRVKKFLMVSSSEVYGDITNGAISETSPLNPKSNYSISKLCGEEYTRAFGQEFGLNFSIVRFFNVYGPGQADAFVVSSFVEAVRNGEGPAVFGDGQQLRAFCYVDDAARGAIAATLNDSANGEVFNVGNDREAMTIAQLADKVLAICPNPGLKPKFVPLENTRRGAVREIYRRVPDISKARRVLGYEPDVSVDEGIRRLWESGARVLDKRHREIFDILTEDALRDKATGPRVSVIVRNHNQSAFLGQALDSLLKQTLPSPQYEVIVVDDGSDDGSREMLQRYADSTRQFFQPRLGAIPALNVGVREARGDYVTIVDADDWVEPSLLTELLDAVETVPGARFSYCDYYERSQAGEAKIISLAANPFEGLAAGFLYDRLMLQEIGGYDNSLALPEYDLLARMLARAPGAHVPKALFHYRRHAGNITNDRDMVERERRKFRERYGEKFAFRTYE